MRSLFILFISAAMTTVGCTVGSIAITRWVARRRLRRGRACDHKRGDGMWGDRRTAISVCRSCRDYVCSTCGLTLEWHEGLLVTNPPVQWRYCAKPACLEVEAAYHGHPVAEMAKHRSALRAKRLLLHLQDRGIEPRPPHIPPEQTILPSGATLIKLTPQPFTLDLGEACWCNRGKDCDGSHEIYFDDPVHVCGLCGETFEIRDDDPHWSTGRGPLCPSRKKTP